MMISGRIVSERGCYSDKRLQKKYVSFADQLGDSGLASCDALIQTYYLYLCVRKLRLWHLLAAYDLVGVSAYVKYAMAKLLDLTAEAKKGPAGGSGRVEVAASMSYKPMSLGKPDGFQLGGRGRSCLCSGSTLAASTMEGVGELDMKISIGLAQWELLAGDAIGLHNLMAACDLAIPLSVNFRLAFSVWQEDWSFELRSGENAAKDQGKRPVLGVSSALGCG